MASGDPAQVFRLAQQTLAWAGLAGLLYGCLNSWSSWVYLLSIDSGCQLASQLLFLSHYWHSLLYFICFYLALFSFNILSCLLTYVFNTVGYYIIINVSSREYIVQLHFIYFGTGSCVAQASFEHPPPFAKDDLEFLTILSLPPKCGNEFLFSDLSMCEHMIIVAHICPSRCFQ